MVFLTSARQPEPPAGARDPGRRPHLALLLPGHQGGLGPGPAAGGPWRLRPRSWRSGRCRVTPGGRASEPGRQAPPQGHRASEGFGQTFEVGEEVTLGRAAGCGVRVEDSYTSSLHARLFRRNGSLWVEDLGSTNGTWVNAERIATPPSSARATCSRWAAPSSRSRGDGPRTRLGAPDRPFRRRVVDRPPVGIGLRRGSGADGQRGPRAREPHPVRRGRRHGRPRGRGDRRRAPPSTPCRPSSPASASADGLAGAIHQANKAVWERGHTDADLRGMGTTMIAAALVATDDGRPPGARQRG